MFGVETTLSKLNPNFLATDCRNPLAIEAGTGAPRRLPRWKISAGTQSNSAALASSLLNLRIHFGAHYLTIAEQKLWSIPLYSTLYAATVQSLG
jgi:hypothetical protein